MTSQETVLAQLAERTGVSLSTIEGATFGERIAKALGWEQGSARIQTLETPVQGGTLSLTKGFLGPHPAVVFADNGSDQSHRVFHEAPRFAYHSSVHWGVIADESGAVVFNSHWIRDDEWYRLPQVPWSESNQSIEPTFPIWLKSFLSNSSMAFQPLSNYGPSCVFPAIITP